MRKNGSVCDDGVIIVLFNFCEMIFEYSAEGIATEISAPVVVVPVVDEPT